MRRSLTTFGTILLVLSSFCFTADSQETGRTQPNNTKSAQKDVRSLWPWSSSSKKKTRFALPFASNAGDERTAQKKAAPSVRGETQSPKSTRSRVRATAPKAPIADSPQIRLSKDDIILPAVTRSGPNGELSLADRSSRAAQRVVQPSQSSAPVKAKTSSRVGKGFIGVTGPSSGQSSRRNGRIVPQDSSARTQQNLREGQKGNRALEKIIKTNVSKKVSENAVKKKNPVGPIVAGTQADVTRTLKRSDTERTNAVKKHTGVAGPKKKNIVVKQVPQLAPKARGESSARQSEQLEQSEVPKTKVVAPWNRLDTGSLGGELDSSILFSKSPLLIVETLGPRKAVLGKESTYRVRLQNVGDVVADAVIVQVNTPLGAQIVSAQGSRGVTDLSTEEAQKPLEWRVERLEPHGTEFLNMRIVPRKSSSFDLSVTWTLAPVASQSVIHVQEPKLNLNIEGPHEVRYGETKLYRLSISNPGTGVAENVELKLMPLDGGEQPMAVRQLGKMEAGAEQILEVELTARQAGYLNVEAVVVADAGLRVASRQRVLVRRANLNVVASGPEMNYAGTIASYRFRLENSGNATAENIRLVASLPAGCDYLDSSDGGKMDTHGRRIVWKVHSLAAKNDQTFQVKVSLSHPGENHFRVAVDADDDLSTSGEVTTRVEALADLELEIKDPRGPVPVDEDTVYEIHISNRGTKAAQGIDVVAFFSKGVEPISATGTDAKISTGQVIFKPIPKLASGSEVVYKIVARAVRGGNHVFRAELKCEDAGVRLVAEENTRFYGSQTVSHRSEATPESTPQDDVPAYRASEK